MSAARCGSRTTSHSRRICASSSAWPRSIGKRLRRDDRPEGRRTPPMTAPDPRIPDSELSDEELEARYPDAPPEPTEREQLIEELATATEERENEIVARLTAINLQD